MIQEAEISWVHGKIACMDRLDVQKTEVGSIKIAGWGFGTRET
jgi:hypothetical protein